MTIHVPDRHRHQVRDGATWVREWEAAVLPGDGLRLVSKTGYVIGDFLAMSVDRLIDLDTCGAGRRLDDVYLRIEIRPA